MEWVLKMIYEVNLNAGKDSSVAVRVVRVSPPERYLLAKPDGSFCLRMSEGDEVSVVIVDFDLMGNSSPPARGSVSVANGRFRIESDGNFSVHEVQPQQASLPRLMVTQMSPEAFVVGVLKSFSTLEEAEEVVREYDRRILTSEPVEMSRRLEAQGKVLEQVIAERDRLRDALEAIEQSGALRRSNPGMFMGGEK
jgi:hypothetical protein